MLHNWRREAKVDVVAGDAALTGASKEEKALATRALRDAGRKYLTDLGVQQQGRSSRYWLLDRGWWIINIEFQSPTDRLGSYLNVGLQYLWDDHRTGQYLQHSFRIDIPGYGPVVSLTGNEAEVHAQAEALGQEARDRVADWLRQFPTDKSHLVWLSKQRQSSAHRENAAIALALLGKHRKAGAMLMSNAEAINLTWDGSGFWLEHQKRMLALAAMAFRPESFNKEVARRIAHKRNELKLDGAEIETWPRVRRSGWLRRFARGEWVRGASYDTAPSPHEEDDRVTTDVDDLRREVAAAIELLEQCGHPRSGDWFREKDRILVAPDVDGSHLATAKMLTASAAGMGRPLEAIYPVPQAGISSEEAERRRDQIIDSMWQISLRMGAD